MSRIEDLIRETLLAHESDAPSGGSLLEGLRARRRRRRAWTAGAAVVAVAGVAAVAGIVTQVLPGGRRGPAQPMPAAPASTSKASIYSLPSDGWKPGDPALDALAVGPFHATRLENGQVCAWFGAGFRPTLWPEGYHVRLHPLQLLGPEGRVIAEAGDVLSAAGGGNPAAAGTPCAKPGQWTWSVMSVPRVTRASRPARDMGTLVGHLYAVGGPAPGGRRGTSGTVTAHGDNGSSTVNTSRDGGFRLHLPTGTYSLNGHSRQYDQGASLCTAPHQVTVKRDQTVTLDVLCQMR